MKESKKILMLTPALPPEINGLGDYAYRLATEFRKHQIETIFICTGKGNIPGFDCHYIQPKKKELLNKIQETDVDIIWINYVGYAYHKRGVPFWLLNAVKKLKNKHKVITYFHESYVVTKSPLKSSFWLSRCQKYLFFQLYRYSYYSFTNAVLYHEILKKGLNKEYIRNKPFQIFSNIPKGTQTEKTIDCIIFGTAQRKQKVYDSEYFNHIIAKLGIKTIIDIGSKHTTPPNLNNLNIIKKDVLPDNEIASYLSKSKYGLIHYPKDLLDKSGICASYILNEVIPINLSDEFSSVNPKGLYEYNRLPVLESPFNSCDLEKIKITIEETSYNYTVESHTKNILSELNV